MKKVLVIATDYDHVEYYGQVGEIIQKMELFGEVQYFVKVNSGAVLVLGKDEVIRIGDWK
jgi:hypothetical protein